MPDQLSLQEKARHILITYDTALYRFIREFSWLTSICAFLTSIVFPAVAGVCSLLRVSPPEWAIVVFGISWLIFSFFTVYGTYHQHRLTHEINPEFVKELREDLEQDKNTVRRLNAQLASIEDTLIALQSLISRKTPPNLEHDLQLLLSTLIENRVKALEYDDKDRAIHNFVVYRFHPQEHAMCKVWRDAPLITPQQNRKWTIGHGHPGMTAELSRPWIVPDERQETNPNLFDEANRENDKRLYASFMSIPVCRQKINDRELAPITFTITSDKPNQFNEKDYMGFCSIYQAILSIYFLTFPKHLRPPRG